MGSSDCDVLIIGAGAAGLAAFCDLDRAGVRVACIEARNRIGGRVFTVHDSAHSMPIELGAEFIHGRPPEIWDLVRAERLKVYDVAEHAPKLDDGGPDRSSLWEEADKVFKEMERAADSEGDQSFASFLATRRFPDDVKRMATSFVEGFNAARKEVIGIASLAIDQRAADEIDGDRGFRVLDGYDAVMNHLLSGVVDARTKLRLNTAAESIQWKPGSVAVTTAAQTFRSERVLITLPLGVLQAEPNSAGSVQFDPEPKEVLDAARALAFGQVTRVVLRFSEAFWERDENLADAGFLFSARDHFPTWWTALPVRVPMITGWSAGPRCDKLLGLSKDEIIGVAVADIAAITKVSAGEIRTLLEAAYMHDWHADPFARGAYSYVPVGALDARQKLTKPVQDTLYFAGEATEVNGHGATVHGAIASGSRAAAQILAAMGRGTYSQT